VPFDGQVFAAVSSPLMTTDFPCSPMSFSIRWLVSDEDRESPPELARAAAVQPRVVRSGVGPLHRVSTWSLPPPCRLLRARRRVCVLSGRTFASIWEPTKGCLVLLLSGVSGSGTMMDVDACLKDVAAITTATTALCSWQRRSSTNLKQISSNASSISLYHSR